MTGLSQIENLLLDLHRYPDFGVLRTWLAVDQALLVVSLIRALPTVEYLPGDSKVPASL